MPPFWSMSWAQALAKLTGSARAGLAASASAAFAVCGITSGSEMMLLRRIWAPFRPWDGSVGQIASLRFWYGSAVVGSVSLAFSPRYGAPEWPLGANGGRSPGCARSSGKAGRPLVGLNRMAGRVAVGCAPNQSRSAIIEPGWPARAGTLLPLAPVDELPRRGRSTQELVFSGSP